MPHFKYLIIGGGMTGDSAVRGIREIDPSGSIAILGAETHPPYNRPPLSKGLWMGKPKERIWRGTDKFNVELYLGRTAKALDPQAKEVTDESGEHYTYDKLLIATGGAPRKLPFGDEQIIYFRTLNDYERLKALADSRQRFLVIGGGFIGSEIAAALSRNGKEVVMAFPEKGIGARSYPTDLYEFLNQFYTDKGVRVLPGALVTGVEKRGEHSAVTLQDVETGQTTEELVDGVVAGLGILPNLELAKGAGLALEDGILVDENLRTSQPDVYAAGDVAAFYNPSLDKRMRVEHEDNANTGGLLAGKAMAGKPEPYLKLPFFFSDLFELGYEAVGELRPDYEVFSDWSEPFKKGVLYTLKEGRVRGVLLWNVWGQVDAARALIAERGPFKASDLKGRLPAASSKD